MDLGGTKIEGIALVGSEERFRHRVATPRDYEGSLDAILSLVELIERTMGERGTVGIGIPGMISQRTGVVKNANSTWLIGKPLGAVLEERLGRPVRLMNDANCFTLSEATDGAGAGFDCAFGVILGTGVGGGITIGGRVHVGANLIGGEWGHNPLPWPDVAELPGPPCYCGRRGCIETYLSGPGMEHDHRAHTGQALSTHEIVRAATAGDAAAKATVARYHGRLGRGLAAVVNLLDPDVIVLGGGMSNLPGLEQAAADAMRPYVFSDVVDTVIRRNVHGDSSGVRGAAWLWPDEETAPAH
ncbi:MAG TPA: ROK family protein [Gemmatimonadaceae bacterium]|nr:ROK family protein [Gemmatimonadaceae bacterium]